MENKESLQHVGILGMRWGHRKSGGSKDSITRTHDSSHNPYNSEDHEKAKNLKTKKLSQMSNAELKEFTTRLNLEKQYKDLTKAETTSGMKMVKEILGNAAKQTAQTYTTKYMTKMVDELIKKAAQSAK